MIIPVDIPTVPPEVADQITETLYTGLELLQTASPFVAAAGAVAIGKMYHKDRKHHSGQINRLAMGDLEPGYEAVEQDGSRFDRVRHAAGSVGRLVANRKVLKTLLLPVSVATFALAAEMDVRKGQVETLDGAVAAMNRASGLPADNHDFLLLTQGGVDTPMDSSSVPLEFSETYGGEPFYVWLPKTGIESSRKMDGLMFGMPGLPEGTVKVTDLTGTEVGEQVVINGKKFTVDEILPDTMQTMRREVSVVSNEIADEIVYGGNGDESWGILIPRDETTSPDDLQARIDETYGEGAYSVYTYEEFVDGIQRFMGGNATALLSLVMAGFIISGATSVIETVRLETRRKSQQAHTLRAIGMHQDDTANVETLKTAYRLAASLPAAALASDIFSKVVNSVNPGLDADATVRTLLGSFVVVAVPSVLKARNAALKTVPEKAIAPGLSRGAE